MVKIPALLNGKDPVPGDYGISVKYRNRGGVGHAVV